MRRCRVVDKCIPTKWRKKCRKTYSHAVEVSFDLIWTWLEPTARRHPIEMQLLVVSFQFVAFLFSSLLAAPHPARIDVPAWTAIAARADPKAAKPKYLESVVVAGEKSKMLAFIRSQRGAPFLIESGYVYRCERHNEQRTYWLCTKYKTVKCGGRLICQGNDIVKYTPHTHDGDPARTSRAVVEYRDMNSPNVDYFLRAFIK